MRRLFILMVVLTAVLGTTAPSASAGGPCIGAVMQDPDQRGFVIGVIRNHPEQAKTLGDIARDCP
jgi:hypothetical protein